MAEHSWDERAGTPADAHTGTRRTAESGAAINPAEPYVRLWNVQGNIWPGFNKDWQLFLFLEIESPSDFKRWLQTLIPKITTAAEVLAFKRAFTSFKPGYRRPGKLRANWINIGFTSRALAKLRAVADHKAFDDEAFAAGLADGQPQDWRAITKLNDPSRRESEGYPANWRVGGPTNPADVILIVASDTRHDLFATAARLEESIYAFRMHGERAASGARIVFKQEGARLPAERGREHFGFRDAVSQPGLRGLASNAPRDFLVARQDPRDTDNFGTPGQRLLQPGEFLFGYPPQPYDPFNPNPPIGDDVHDKSNPWMDDGSYLVFRRLRQDVAKFHRFVQRWANSIGFSPNELAAKIVGRWPSGAPLMRSPNHDTPTLGGNDCANNDFNYYRPDPHVENPRLVPPDQPPSGSEGFCEQVQLYRVSQGDRNGTICPFFSRKRSRRLSAWDDG